MKILKNTFYKYVLITAICSISTVNYADVHEHMDHSKHLEMMKNQNKAFSISKNNYDLSDIEILTSSGEKTTLLKELDTDTPVMLNFIFTTCTSICPIMSGTFAEVNKKLSKEPVKMISISIDPEYDTPKTLRTYAKKFSANKKWHFYTGSTDNIINIQKSFADYKGNKMNHSPSTFLRSSKNSKWTKVDGFISSNELVKIFNKNKSM